MTGPPNPGPKKVFFISVFLVELLPNYGKNDNLKILKSLPKPLGQLQTNWKGVLFFSKKGEIAAKM